MFLLYAKAPLPDSPYWSGRRWFAALDAVIWPAFWMLGATQIPVATGIVGPFVQIAAVLLASSRIRVALWRNERYRFTTWRWGRLFLLLWAIGWMLKWFAVP